MPDFMDVGLIPKYKERRNGFGDFLTIGKIEIEPTLKSFLKITLYPKKSVISLSHLSYIFTASEITFGYDYQLIKIETIEPNHLKTHFSK